MASLIVHLRIAESLLNLTDGLDPVIYSMGNIAPDSGIPDENWEKFDPPQEILHFKANNRGKWSLADLEFYRQYLHPQKVIQADTDRFSFLLGYFSHLVTDNLWDEQIAWPTRERFEVEFNADPRFIWQVKRDWYGLDFEYVRRKPESLYWRVFLDCEYNHNYLPFLPKEALQQRLAYIQAFYQRTDEKIETWYINRPNEYLSEREMDAFIQAASGRPHRIFKHLWRDWHNLPEISSSLDLDIQ